MECKINYLQHAKLTKQISVVNFACSFVVYFRHLQFLRQALTIAQFGLSTPLNYDKLPLLIFYSDTMQLFCKRFGAEIFKPFKT